MPQATQINIALFYIKVTEKVTEVLARIKANIRRNTQYLSGSASDEKIITGGELVINTSEYSVLKNGKKIELTAKEFENK